MALGDGIGRNKGVHTWIQQRQNDYCKGAKEFIEWLLNNSNYAACMAGYDVNVSKQLLRDAHDVIKQLLDERNGMIVMKVVNDRLNPINL